MYFLLTAGAADAPLCLPYEPRSRTELAANNPVTTRTSIVHKIAGMVGDTSPAFRCRRGCGENDPPPPRANHLHYRSTQLVLYPATALHTGHGGIAAAVEVNLLVLVSALPQREISHCLQSPSSP